MPLDHAQRSSFGSRTRMSTMCHLTMLNGQASTHSLCQKVDQLQSHITLVTSKDTERIAGNMWDTGRDVWNVIVVHRTKGCAQSGSKCTGRTDSHGTLFLVQEEACNHVCFVGCCSWRAGSDKEMYSTPVLSESALDTDSKRGGVHVNCAQALAQRQ